MFEKLKGTFKKVAIKTLDEKNLEKALQEFQLELLRNDVANQAATKICDFIKKEQLLEKEVGRHRSVKKLIRETLKQALLEILTPTEPLNLFELIDEKNKAVALEIKEVN